VEPYGPEAHLTIANHCADLVAALGEYQRSHALPPGLTSSTATARSGSPAPGTGCREVLWERRIRVTTSKQYTRDCDQDSANPHKDDRGAARRSLDVPAACAATEVPQKVRCN
jgi:hypothetical protein